MRSHAARGTLINSGFQIGLSALGAIQRLVAAAFLTTTEFGLWGIVVAIVVNLALLKDLGIGDKYVQQSEPDQEAAFQKAFTLELASSLAFFGLVALVLPLWATAYGRAEIIFPALLVTLAVPLSAFEIPSWIPYRRLQYARQRLLIVIDPLVSFVVTITLAVMGAGYWCFIGGMLAGSVAGGLVCTITSPYPLRLRLDRSTVRDYASFSWPLVGAGLSRLFVVQGALLVANHVVGLAGVGVIGIATIVSVFAERVDTIVSQTIYPVVCAVADRLELLSEAFVKSNRIALMWAVPFGVGLALFAGDLVSFVIGEQWRPAVGLLAAFGLTVGFGHVAFNWAIFLRAVNKTRPIFISAVVNVVVFLGVAIPGMFAFGVAGYAIGFAAATLVQVLLRGYYMRQLFGGFNVFTQLARGIAPTVPPAALILLLHAALDVNRTPGLAMAEFAAYTLGVLVLTLLFERRLVAEMLGYLRRQRGKAVA